MDLIFIRNNDHPILANELKRSACKPNIVIVTVAIYKLVEVVTRLAMCSGILQLLITCCRIVCCMMHERKCFTGKIYSYTDQTAKVFHQKQLQVALHGMCLHKNKDIPLQLYCCLPHNSSLHISGKYSI